MNYRLLSSTEAWWRPSFPQNAHSSLETVLAIASLVSCVSSYSASDVDSPFGSRIPSLRRECAEAGVREAVSRT